MTIEPHHRRPDSPEALAADMIIPMLACGLAIYYLVSTAALAWEARATGTTIAVILLCLCGVLFARSGLKVVRGIGRFGFGDLFETSNFNRQRLALIALLVLFVATIPWLGTTLGLFLLLLASLRVMGVTSTKQLLGIALVASSVVYLLFIFLLNSRLPRGILENTLSQLLLRSGG